jgi:hypothetical protein
LLTAPLRNALITAVKSFKTQAPLACAVAHLRAKPQYLHLCPAYAKSNICERAIFLSGACATKFVTAVFILYPSLALFLPLARASTLVEFRQSGALPLESWNSLDCKSYIKVEGTESDKHSSLLRYGIDYGLKSIHVKGPCSHFGHIEKKLFKS